MQQRTITEEMVIWAIRNPDKTFVEEDGDIKFICEIRGDKIHVVCKPVPEEAKWLVKSTWVRGEDDEGNKVEYRRSRPAYQQRGQASQYRQRSSHSVRPSQPGSASSMRSLVINMVLIIALIGLVAMLVLALTR